MYDVPRTPGGDVLALPVGWSSLGGGDTILCIKHCVSRVGMFACGCWKGVFFFCVQVPSCVIYQFWLFLMWGTE